MTSRVRRDGFKVSRFKLGFGDWVSSCVVSVSAGEFSVNLLHRKETDCSCDSRKVETIKTFFSRLILK